LLIFYAGNFFATAFPVSICRIASLCKTGGGGWAGTIRDTEERVFHVICSSFVFYLFEKIVVCYLTGNTKVVKD
jgi:hypothetical protein